MNRTRSPTPATSRPPRVRRLRRKELPVDTVALARFLLGKLVVRELPRARLMGRIVETEAYLVGDAACHAFRGMTERNRSLFRAHGHAYVYLAYGSSWMLNVSGEPEGTGAGVLIRALEPVSGVAAMERARGTRARRDLLRGPGRLAQAFAIDRALDGTDLCARGPIWLGDDGADPDAPGASVRIGITKDAERILRFYVRGSRYVSGPARLNP